MRRSDIIRELSNRIYGDTRPDSIQVCSQFCDTLVDIITDALCGGEKISWNGFMTIELVKRDERCGKNPKTNQLVTFPSVISIKCKMCQSIKDRVNDR